MLDRVLVSSFSPKLIGAASLLVLASACSPAPTPISQSPRDPSSPSAPEGVTPTVASPAVATAKSHEHEHEHEHGTGAVYECPMHPEVTSGAPGVCPKCNMKLVPKK